MKQKLSLLTAAAFLMGSSAFAAPGVGYVGGLLGYTKGSKSSLNNNASGSGRFSFGADAGYFVMPEFSIGAYFLYSSKKEGSLTQSIKVLQYGVDGKYAFSGDLEGLQAGAKVGFTTSSIGATNTVLGTIPSINLTQFTFGPTVSYDYVIGGGFSLGAELDYLLALKKKYSYTVGSTVTEVDAKGFAIFNALATVKYWF